MTALKKYSWPGNARELRNVCENLYLLSKEEVIGTADLPLQFFKVNDDMIFKMDYDPAYSLHDVEKAYILLSLGHYNGNKAKAAKSLGISNKTLYNKLHEYGVFEEYSYHKKK